MRTRLIPGMGPPPHLGDCQLESYLGFGEWPLAELLSSLSSWWDDVSLEPGVCFLLLFACPMRNMGAGARYCNMADSKVLPFQAWF